MVFGSITLADNLVGQAPHTIVIAGPTAVGKTALAIDLASKIGGEIINADSMQVYRGMDIGTAKPPIDARKGVKFHLIDIVDPDVNFTVARWREVALAALVEIRGRGHIPILCGGTGFYLRSLFHNWGMAETPRDDSIRRQLESDAAIHGIQALHKRLESVDRDSANRLHPNDTSRVVRALEVYLASGIPISEHHRKDREMAANPLAATACQVILNMDRSLLFNRINERVDQMISQGLEMEVKRLLGDGFSETLAAMKSLGYKEMCGYVRGEYSIRVATELVKTNTRRYAKRQLTWFRAERGATWIDLSIFNAVQAIEQITEIVMRPISITE